MSNNQPNPRKAVAQEEEREEEASNHNNKNNNGIINNSIILESMIMEIESYAASENTEAAWENRKVQHSIQETAYGEGREARPSKAHHHKMLRQGMPGA